MVSLLGLGACGGSEVAGEGAVLKTWNDTTSGVARVSVMPTGTLELTIGDPVKHLPAEDLNVEGNHDWKAPEESSFVPVHVSMDFTEIPWGGLLARDAQEAHVSLSVDGQERELPTPYYVLGPALQDNPDTTYYVEVPGSPDPEEIVASVSYDGKSEALSAYRSAANRSASGEGEGMGLADLVDARPEKLTCPEKGWSSPEGVRTRILCDDLFVGVTPYWPGKGWAADGTVWRFVEVTRLAVLELKQGKGVYSTDRVRGWAAGEELLGRRVSGSVNGQAVFADTDSVRLEVEVEGRLDEGRGPEEISPRFTRDLPLP